MLVRKLYLIVIASFFCAFQIFGQVESTTTGGPWNSEGTWNAVSSNIMDTLRNAILSASKWFRPASILANSANLVSAGNIETDTGKDGNGGKDGNKNQIPKKFALSQNYQNPFNPTSTIDYQLPKASSVILDIYDVLGQNVKTLVKKEQAAGYYNIHFDASTLSSGIYFTLFTQRIRRINM